jgi:hypothetical protein
LTAAGPAFRERERFSTPPPASTGPVVRTDEAAARTPGPLKVLLVCATFKMPYRVLRCAAAVGAEVHVLCASRGRDLAWSRHCRGLTLSGRPIDGQFDPDLAGEINRHAARIGATTVLAGDAHSTRSLIAVRPLIAAPLFPMPELSVFDLLNDKWKFAELCASLGIECPRTRLYAGVDDLRADIDRGALEFPLIAKPLSMNGAVGCVTLERDTARDRLAEIFYSPVLVQEFIHGRDIGASVFCRRGEIIAFIAHSYGQAIYSTFEGCAIRDTIAMIAERFEFDGVYNFDMRLTPDGRVVWLECNPRFFYKIAMSMLAGVNFVAFGLPGAGGDERTEPAAPANILFPKAMLAALARPWKPRGSVSPALGFIFGDFIPNLREAVGLEDHTGEFDPPA